ncbi:MAG: hypothetical protein MRY83_16865 [Flavobacteriales bacterium]|nr:hypothetical protein [Flavobacteriales bacterium]
MILKWNRGIISLFFLCINLPIHAVGELGGVWVDTLNFSHSIGLKSGIRGNIKSVEGKNYDVDEIHVELEKEAKKVAKATGTSHNVVVAGFSLIMKIADDRYEFIYVPLKETNSTMAFVSGAVGRSYSQQGTTFIGASDSFVPQKLLENFGQRIGDFGGSFRPLNHDSIARYYEEWIKAQSEALTESKASVVQLATEPHESIYSFYKAIENAIDLKINEANKGFGSAIDSEQFLLHYFDKPEKGLGGTETTNLAIKHNALLGKYKTEKLKSLRAKFSKEASSTENIEKIRESMDRFQQELDQFERMEEIGCILHLHSTNEICCCCGYSFAQELRHGNLSKIKESMKIYNGSQSSIEPFFSILVSASQLVPDVKDNRPGIGIDSRLADLQDGLVPIEFSISEGVFLQKLLNSGSGSASSPSSSSSTSSSSGSTGGR